MAIPITGVGTDPFAGMAAINTNVSAAATSTDGSAAVDGAASASGSSFASLLANKISALGAQQTSASNEMTAVATGKVDDVAQSMVRIEQANVSLQMATQVRSKIIEAYNDVIHMQI
jgi:flagellar hook-basal body complex protein FliE